MKIFCFEISEQLHIEDPESQLARAMVRVRRSEKTVHSIFYDSFDWRLLSANLTLEAVRTADQISLCLRSSSNEGEEVCLPEGVTLPRFADQFDDLHLRSKLQPVLDLRALLPRLELSGQRIVLHQLNQQDKCVLRVYIDVLAVAKASGQAAVTERRVSVVAFKGYTKASDQLIALLHDQWGLQACDHALLWRGLAALKRRPLDYSSKLSIRLKPDIRCDVALQIIVSHLVTALKRNESGVKEAIDTEFLHDFRVAIRRLRSLFGQFKDIFPGPGLRSLATECAWLGGLTGTPRDLDVYVLAFDGFKNALPVTQREDLEPLRVYLEKRVDAEYRQLAKHLSSRRYVDLLRRLNRFIEAPLTEESDAARSVSRVAKRRIWSLYRRVLKCGGQIDDGTPDEALHDLRKKCKKLRYMIEFFSDLYPPAKIRKCVRILKALQQNLGEIQDLAVQQDSMAGFARDMMKQPTRPPVQTLLAMGALVQQLSAAKKQARVAFAEKFEAFQASRHQALFESLFAPKKMKPAKVS